MKQSAVGKRLLRGFLLAFGIACQAIAVLHLVLGSAAIPGSLPVSATMDSEDRFYAALFLGFGAAIVWCAGALEARRDVLHALLATFFAGGVARLISWAAMGQPAALFVGLGAVELILPPVLWVATR